MTVRNASIFKRSPHIVAGFAALLISTSALAQSAQQLPADVANQQVPQAFPDQDAPSALAPVSDQIIPSQDAQAAKAKEEQAASEPAAEDVPAQPEARTLVPATPMGAAAQGVVGNQNNQQLQQQQSAGATQAQGQAAPAMPDILEKYTSQSQANSSDVAANGDALPQYNVPALDPNLMNAPVKQEQSKEELQEEIRSEAYDAAITGLFPMSPDQIQGLLKQYDATQKATQTPVYTPPTPQISVQNISLDPGVAPPSIKTAVGNVTTINILDATGAPWPVQDVTWAGDYEVVEPEQGGHIIRITPMSEFARGNIVIRMLTLKTPLTLTLETGRDVVQYRVDARIPEYGPFASAPLMQGGKSMVAGSSELTSILDGVMPGGMAKLEVVGVDGRTTAYAGNGTTYVRTPLTLLSPAWQSSVSSADGMNVYALSNAPVLLLSDGGEFMRATLKEKEDLLDE